MGGSAWWRVVGRARRARAVAACGRPDAAAGRRAGRGAAASGPVGSAVRLSALRRDDRYRDTFLREFDSLTPENE
jgi:hypothetical protein